jgi:REP element-mobilizing transposase RayT
MLAHHARTLNYIHILMKYIKSVKINVLMPQLIREYFILIFSLHYKIEKRLLFM